MASWLASAPQVTIRTCKQQHMPSLIALQAYRSVHLGTGHVAWLHACPHPRHALHAAQCQACQPCTLHERSPRCWPCGVANVSGNTFIILRILDMTRMSSSRA